MEENLYITKFAKKQNLNTTYNYFKFKIYRNKSPQRMLLWPLPSEVDNYYTHLARFLWGRHVALGSVQYTHSTMSPILSWPKEYSILCTRHDQPLPTPPSPLSHPSPSIWSTERTQSSVWKFCQTKTNDSVFVLNYVWSMGKGKILTKFPENCQQLPKITNSFFPEIRDSIHKYVKL